jgi:hypothetical protein
MSEQESKPRPAAERSSQTTTVYIKSLLDHQKAMTHEQMLKECTTVAKIYNTRHPDPARGLPPGGLAASILFSIKRAVSPSHTSHGLFETLIKHMTSVSDSEYLEGRVYWHQTSSNKEKAMTAIITLAFKYCQQYQSGGLFSTFCLNMMLVNLGVRYNTNSCTDGYYFTESEVERATIDGGVGVNGVSRPGKGRKDRETAIEAALQSHLGYHTNMYAFVQKAVPMDNKSLDEVLDGFVSSLRDYYSSLDSYSPGPG